MATCNWSPDCQARIGVNGLISLAATEGSGSSSHLLHLTCAQCRKDSYNKMAETSAAAVLELPAERVSIMDSSSFDTNSSTMPSPSSAATSFELPSKALRDQAASSLQPQASTLQPQFSSTPPLSFLALPSDIHHLILTSYLPYDSIVALRSASSQFHSLIPPATLKRLRQNVISQLLTDERALLKKWLPQPYGRWSGRPNSHMNCYSCLQSLPTTQFFAYQVGQSRGLGRKRAAERWCKPCGLKYGKISHGRWIDEVSYSTDDQLRYETVMGEELTLKNPCVTCPEKDRYDGQRVWWGCVDCFEKEEKKLQKQDSERRRDLRRHCSRVKRGAKAFVEPEYLHELGHATWRWMRTRLGWHATVRRGYNVYWWARDESLLRKACRTCGRVGRVLDPRQMQEPGERLGRKAKRAVGAVFELAKKNQKKDESGAADGDGTSTTSGEDCVICCTEAVDPSRPKTVAPSSHRNRHHHCVTSPHREVRCWRCWRAKRSRRRRRYDDGLAFGAPLRKERWCNGCQTEHESFVALKREKNQRAQERERREHEMKRRLRREKKEENEREGEGEEANKEDANEDVGLCGLFDEV